MTKMNSEIKKQWIEALRSGKYPQTAGYLNVVETSDEKRMPVGYCCLGVLSDLAEKNGVCESSMGEPYTDLRGGTYTTRYFGTGKDMADDFQPEKVTDWAMLPKFDPEVTVINQYNEEESKSLSELNDEGWSFDKIADVIEEQL